MKIFRDHEMTENVEIPDMSPGPVGEAVGRLAAAARAFPITQAKGKELKQEDPERNRLTVESHLNSFGIKGGEPVLGDFMKFPACRGAQAPDMPFLGLGAV